MNSTNPLYRQIKRLKIKRRLRFLQNKLKAGVKREGVGKKEIVAGLSDLGITGGDAVLLHSSLSRLGMVDGGPVTVVSALLDLLGDEGTLAASTIHLRKQATEHFAEDPVFDVRESPSTMGAISETVRRLPEAKRSLHPTHSIAAVGRHAGHLTEDHHKSDRPFGPYSPYYRLAELGGKVILLGVPLASMTNFHVVEDILEDNFPYPVYMPETVKARVVGPNGEQLQIETRIHNPEMSARRRCNDLEEVLLSRHVIKIGPVGSARTTVVAADALNKVLIDLLDSGITMYTPDGVPITI